ncbi:uncharacterized protein [Nicotiana sylvestris]|uniref:uncharacterized protein n=1 Tax=Nicotiana sylvestris TaxID=4096 RepID=UPI00388C98D6
MGLHQGSTLSPFLFALAIDALTHYIQGEVSWCMLFADGIVIIDVTRGGIDERPEVWKQTLESKGFKLNKTKIEYMEFKNAHIHKIKVAEIRMLRWMCGHMRLDKIRNKDISERVGITPMDYKMWEARLRWFDQVRRRSPDAPVMRCEWLALAGTRRGRGRPKKYWGKVIRQDMARLQISEYIALDRNACRSSIRIVD